MRFEILVLILAAGIIANIYTEGKYLHYFMLHKKYLQMMAVAGGALFLLWLFRWNPSKAESLIHSSNEYLKYLPLDRSATPIVDFTKKWPTAATAEKTDPGRKKRSVSETKKKWVASNQNWRCGECGKQLPAWFEVDHKLRLDHGGSNHVDNLVALCRDCHGKKTAIENL